MATTTMTVSTAAHAGKILVAGVDNSAFPKSNSRALADVVAGAVSRAGHDVVTPQQLEALVGLDAAKQLAGCADDGCVARMSADLGGALGVDAVLTVSANKAGSGAVLAVKRIDARGGGARVADHRLKSLKIDGALDALPALVAEVLAGMATSTSTTTPTTPTTTSTASTTSTTTSASSTTPWMPAGLVPSRAPPKGPSGRAPLLLAKDLKAKLKVVDDGAGNVVVFNGERALDGPLLAGNVKTGVFAQRTISGSGEGDVAFDIGFWDARVSSAAERSFSLKDGAYRLHCGKTAQDLRPSSPAVTALALRKPFDVAWLRHVILVGRDDDLHYYIVDDSLADDDDLRVYVGKKVQGAYRFSAIDGEVVRDGSFGEGVLVVGDGFKLKLGATGGELVVGARVTPISGQNLYALAADIYAVMRPWGAVPLQTPCDPYLQ
jgi:hypothetical protein